jgi:hypothetical protein
METEMRWPWQYWFYGVIVAVALAMILAVIAA